MPIDALTTYAHVEDVGRSVEFRVVDPGGYVLLVGQLDDDAS